MASLKSEVKYWIDDIREGSGWMLVWKTGRNWDIIRMFDAWYDEDSAKLIVCHTDTEIIREAVEADQNAMLLNGYRDNLADLTEESLCKAIKQKHDTCGGILLDVVDSQR